MNCQIEHIRITSFINSTGGIITITTNDPLGVIQHISFPGHCCFAKQFLFPIFKFFSFSNFHMQILKFGGSSVANAANINQCIAIIHNAVEKDKTIVVVSALGGITDALLHCATAAAVGDENYAESLKNIEQRHLDMVRELIPVTDQSSMLSMVKKTCNGLEDIFKGVFLLRELSARTKDNVLSFGELLSSRIISAALAAQNIPNSWKDSRDLITTDAGFGHALVDFDTTWKKMDGYFQTASASLFIVPGFIASDSRGITTTLGRGGSDYTAAIYGNALNSRRIEIWTDVSGMMTADPRLVTNARVIPDISYQEAMELSHFGAKVIYPPTLQPVMNKGIPVWIKNTFAPEDPGTLIEKISSIPGNSIRGISSIHRIALLSLEGSGMIGIPGFSKRLFEALSRQQINVILITQASSEHSICVGVDSSQAAIAKISIDDVFAIEIKSGTVLPLIVEEELAIVALVGDNMKSHPGISGKLFGVLGRNGINVRAIAQGSSERNISAVISTKDVKKAVNVLHEEFFEATYKQLNLFYHWHRQCRWKVNSAVGSAEKLPAGTTSVTGARYRISQ